MSIIISDNASLLTTKQIVETVTVLPRGKNSGAIKKNKGNSTKCFVRFAWNCLLKIISYFIVALSFELAFPFLFPKPLLFYQCAIYHQGLGNSDSPQLPIFCCSQQYMISFTLKRYLSAINSHKHVKSFNHRFPRHFKQTMRTENITVFFKFYYLFTMILLPCRFTFVFLLFFLLYSCIFLLAFFFLPRTFFFFWQFFLCLPFILSLFRSIQTLFLFFSTLILIIVSHLHLSIFCSTFLKSIIHLILFFQGSFKTLY